MSGWAAKRFWAEALVVACEGGHTVRLDARPVRTPAKTLLVVPTLAMAEAIAAEWQAQQGVVKPETMPVTRSANAALDKVTPQFNEVVDLVAAYGATDLLCYRATTPQGLVDRQATGWDPVLNWAGEALRAPLKVTAGIAHIAQPEPSIAALSARTAAMTPFQLTGFHDLVAITGSLVLALAVTDRLLTAEQAWDMSRIDEVWQAEQWGADEDAAAAEVVRREGLLHASRFYFLCG